MSAKRIEPEFVSPSEIFRSAEINIGSTSAEREPKPKRPIAWLKTMKYSGIAAAAVVVGGGIYGAVNFGQDYVDAMAFHAETEGKVVDMGEAEIINVDMDIQPITVSTAETLVKDVKVAYETKIANDFINLSLGSNTVTRAAKVETEITIDPGKVNIMFDPEKDQLTFSALDTALSTEVDFNKGSVRTTDKTGNVLQLPADWITKVSEAIDGTFGTDNSKVPIIREIAAGTLNINEGLERYADLTILTQVDKECTPLIPTAIDDFEGQLKANIKEAVQGKLLDEATTNELSTKLREEMSLAEIQELVENAVVEIPANFEIGPDEEALQMLADYEKSAFFTTVKDSESSMVCGVKESDELTPKDGGSDD